MSKIVPIKNSISIGNTTNSSIAEFKNKQPVPIINDNDDIILEVNSIGPLGPPGKTGNGIDRIEKTASSGLVDTYTIFFTDGREFNYEVTNGVVYYYNGPYEVTPSTTSQILPTANLVMSDDVNINQIPYYEVSNLSGGKTASIGEI